MLCQEALDIRQEDKELQRRRALFVGLIHMSTVKELNLKGCLLYRLTPAPLTFVHIDGLRTSTDKSTIFNMLEVRIIIDAPRNVDVCSVDGMFMFSLMKIWFQLLVVKQM